MARLAERRHPASPSALRPVPPTRVCRLDVTPACVRLRSVVLESARIREIAGTGTDLSALVGGTAGRRGMRTVGASGAGCEQRAVKRPVVRSLSAVRKRAGRLRSLLAPLDSTQPPADLGQRLPRKALVFDFACLRRLTLRLARLRCVRLCSVLPDQQGLALGELLCHQTSRKSMR